jgi:hypothetical protein
MHVYKQNEKLYGDIPVLRFRWVKFYLFIYLFVYGSFNDAIDSLDYTWSNDNIINRH